MLNLTRRAARKAAALAAPRIPLSAYLRFNPRFPIGFFYHAVSDERLPHVRHLYPFKSTTAFETDLRWLKENTSPIGYSDLLAHARQGAPLPPKGAYLSFDDGFRECYDVARPLLLKHGIPCIFFLTTDWIDNKSLFFRSKLSLIIETLEELHPIEREAKIRSFATAFGAPEEAQDFVRWLRAHKEAGRQDIDEMCARLDIDSDKFLKTRQPYLTRAQISEMQGEGFVFGAHTLDHTKLMHLSPEGQTAQIVESCRIVAALTGQAQVPFAFPFSGDQVSRKMLREVQGKHPEVGLIFDTKKLRREAGVLHRIWADRPVRGIDDGNNLAFWLHDAYQRSLLEARSG